jgi:hypothetical protein
MHTLRFSLPVLLAAGLVAQTTVVVPSGALVGPPNQNSWWSSNVFYSTTSTTTLHDSRTQLIYATSDIPTPVAILNSVSVRRPGKGGGSYLGNNNAAMTANATITMSMSPMAYNATGTTFAANHGPSPVTVLNGPVSLPVQASQNIWPFPWEAPIMFTTPFTYVGSGGSTVVCDILQTGNTGTSSWYVEAYNRDVGSRGENGGAQSTCKFSNAAYNSGLGYTSPVVGGTWYVNNQGGLPANMVGFGALGSQGVGGTWSGIPLPIDMAAYGAPGCKWNVEILISTPLIVMGTSANIYQWPTLPIPNNPALAGVNYSDQSLVLDPLANAWGVVAGWSSTWTIGSGVGALARHVGTSGNTAATATTGSNSAGLGVSLKFN